LVPWCSGLAYVPVKDEIAGSNPVGTADPFEKGRSRQKAADSGVSAHPPWILMVPSKGEVYPVGGGQTISCIEELPPAPTSLSGELLIVM
jgi:hypothetical protein